MSEEAKPQGSVLRALLLSLWRWNGEKEINWEGVSAFYGGMSVLCIGLKLLGETYPLFAGWWVVLFPFVPCAIVTLCGLFVNLVTTNDHDNSTLSAEAQARKLSKITGKKED